MNARHRRFVDEYLIDLNGTRAVTAAGFTTKYPQARASKLLQVQAIKDAIAAAMAERSKRTRVDQDYVLRNLTEVVERTMQRAPVMVRQGKEMVQATDEEGNNVWQFDARGAVASLNLLGKHLGMFTERIEHSGKIEGSGVLAVPVPLESEQWANMARRQQTDLLSNPTQPLVS